MSVKGVKVELTWFKGCTGCSTPRCFFRNAVRGDSHRAAGKAKDVRWRDLYGCNTEK